MTIDFDKLFGWKDSAHESTLYKPHIKEAVLGGIYTNLSLHGGGIAVVGDKKDALLMKWIIDNEYVSKETLEHDVHESICNIGRNMLVWHLTNPLRNYPDHALSPEAFGYAMKHGAISSEEIARIHFDHGQTADVYILSSQGLLEKVMRQLAEGTAFYDLSCLSDDSDLFSTHDHVCC